VNSIQIYKTINGKSNVEVIFNNDTVWLNLSQLAELFDRDKSVISRHLNKIFRDNELVKDQVVAKNATTAADGKTYQVEYFNLDAILSVGYRVNSAQGTQFRIWANSILKDHLINGYTQNLNRLKDLKKTVEIVSRIAKSENAITNEASDLLEVLANYTAALNILDDYDHQRLKIHTSENDAYFRINYTEAKNAIELLKIKFGESELFGREKDQSFKSSIAVIDQTFDGKELYRSIEEKAAHLLYFVIKNHSFNDGNKRIAAWLFIWYLEKNHFLYTEYGKVTISESTLVALTLMIAESRPEEKDVIIKVIINLIQLKDK
jgi:prophage maintenance system killer protein